MKISPKNIVNQIVDKIKPIYEESEARAIGRMILEELFEVNSTDLVLNKEIELTRGNLEKLPEIIARLLNHEPIQHILGYAWFMGKKYRVGPDVLVPRQETEELVDLILRENDKPGLKILDIGTGSGCIGISLEYLLPDADVHALDVTESSLKIAAENAQNNDVNITFYQVDILKEFPPLDEIDLIVSNPPYVTEKEKVNIKKNVLDYEPEEALFVPDDDPLVFYHRIADLALQKLKVGGRLYFELNESLGPETEQLLLGKGFKEVKTYKDLNGKDRMAVGVKF